MLRIRLSRVGAKKQPHYRIVVTERRSKRDGKPIERIGHYDPRKEGENYMIDEARALHWLSVGAKPSEAVERMLVKQGTIDRLAKLRAGESFDELVAEYTGIAPEATAAKIVEEIVAAADSTDEEE